MIIDEYIMVDAGIGFVSWRTGVITDRRRVVYSTVYTHMTVVRRRAMRGLFAAK